MEGVDDAQNFQALKRSLDIVGITQEEQMHIFSVVSAILHIGNIRFDTSREEAAITDDSMPNVNLVASLLGYTLGFSFTDFFVQDNVSCSPAAFFMFEEFQEHKVSGLPRLYIMLEAPKVHCIPSTIHAKKQWTTEMRWPSHCILNYLIG